MFLKFRTLVVSPFQTQVPQRKDILPKSSYRLLVVSGTVDGNSDTCPEAEPSISSEGKAIHMQLPLPRRRLLVAFTCEKCGAKSQRLINRLSYDHDLVFVQDEHYNRLAAKKRPHN